MVQTTCFLEFPRLYKLLHVFGYIMLLFCQQLFDLSLIIHYWKLGIIAEKSHNLHAAQCLWDSLKYRYCHSWTFSSGIICLMIGYANILLSWNTVCLEKGEDLEEKLEWTLRSEGRKHSIPGEEGDFFYNACGLYSWYFLHLWIARCS